MKRRMKRRMNTKPDFFEAYDVISAELNRLEAAWPGQKAVMVTWLYGITPGTVEFMKTLTRTRKRRARLVEGTSLTRPDSLSVDVAAKHRGSSL